MRNNDQYDKKTIRTIMKLKVLIMILALINTLLMAIAAYLVLDIFQATSELVTVTNNNQVMSEIGADVASGIARNSILGKQLCVDTQKYYDDCCKNDTEVQFRYAYEHTTINTEDLESACASIYALANVYQNFSDAIGVEEVKEQIAYSVSDIQSAVTAYNKMVSQQNDIISQYNNRLYCKIAHYYIDFVTPLTIAE